jgi:hypothetical protein
MFKVQVLLLLALCLLIPTSTLGQGQAYWLPPAARGGISPSSPYTSGQDVTCKAGEGLPSGAIFFYTLCIFLLLFSNFFVLIDLNVGIMFILAFLPILLLQLPALI